MGYWSAMIKRRSQLPPAKALGYAVAGGIVVFVALYVVGLGRSHPFHVPLLISLPAAAVVFVAVFIQDYFGLVLPPGVVGPDPVPGGLVESVHCRRREKGLSALAALPHRRGGGVAGADVTGERRPGRFP